MSLLNVYKSILSYAGLDTNEDGYAYMKGDPSKPTILSGARLVLPTQEHLRNPSDEKLIFHPLVEDIVRNETEIVSKLRKNINVRLNLTVAAVASSLLQLVASPAVHGNLTPEQGQLLTSIKDADEKAVENFSNYITQNTSDKNNKAERLFLNIFLKRGGALDGKKYNRLAVIHFPFYMDLMDGKIEKIRVKDKEPYRQIMEFIFPDIAETDAYSYGSDGSTAPFLEALMIGSGKIADRLNELILLYRDYIDDPEALLFDLEWADSFADLSCLAAEIRNIPRQRVSDASLDLITNEQAKPQAIPVQQVIPQYAPQPMHPQPQFMPQAPKPAIAESGKGLDFKSLMRSSPQLAMMPNALAPAMMQRQGMPMQQVQERPPSWAPGPTMGNFQNQGYPQQQSYPPQQQMGFNQGFGQPMQNYGQRPPPVQPVFGIV